jgi:hypothetical protein
MARCAYYLLTAYAGTPRASSAINPTAAVARCAYYLSTAYAETLRAFNGVEGVFPISLVERNGHSLLTRLTGSFFDFDVVPNVLLPSEQ